MGNLCDGLLVLDITNNIAGPCTAMLLAERGAEVIHIEKPVMGDDNRYFPPIVQGTSYVHGWANKGKKSVTLDLKDPRAKAVIYEMIKKADVLIESYRPGVMDKLGYGYEEVKALNPGLIYCSVSAFGHSGPNASKPGYDVIAQAYSGLMYLTGDSDGDPTKIGYAIGDFVGSINAFGSVMAALYYREKTGKGQHVDVSLARGLFWFNGAFSCAYTGRDLKRTGNHASGLCPYGVYNGKDGSCVIGAVNVNTWVNLCKCMNRPDLMDDPAWRTNDARAEHRQEVIKLVSDWVMSFDHIDDVCELLDKAGVPVSKIKSPGELLHDDHARECGWLADIPAPGSMDSLDAVIGTVGLSDYSEFGVCVENAHDLGEDNMEVLTRFGMTPEEVENCQREWAGK